MLGRFLQVETRVGDPIPAGDTTIIPLAKSLQIRLPGGRGGVIWNRPASVAVQTAGGQEYILPIRDITRQVQFSLYAGSLLGVFLMWLLMRRKTKTQAEKESE
jgi:hypothetical protein